MSDLLPGHRHRVLLLGATSHPKRTWGERWRRKESDLADQREGHARHAMCTTTAQEHLCRNGDDTPSLLATRPVPGQPGGSATVEKMLTALHGSV